MLIKAILHSYPEEITKLLLLLSASRADTHLFIFLCKTDQKVVYEGLQAFSVGPIESPEQPNL